MLHTPTERLLVLPLVFSAQPGDPPPPDEEGDPPPPDAKIKPPTVSESTTSEGDADAHPPPIIISGG
jgi:hypothetical protein